ncbi:MAG: hypothetical protein SFU86_06500 [Pirellulaceae bacterium]|nr:hypothetical protein [Pirellulaceae bacterium]
MELFILLPLVLLAWIAIQFGQMLFRRGPNHWRNLLRVDLAAMLVLITGVAGALALVRSLDPWAAACVLTLALPAAIAFAWMGRYLLEDLARSRRRAHGISEDAKFAWPPAQPENPTASPPEEILAEAVDEARIDSPPTTDTRVDHP